PLRAVPGPAHARRNAGGRPSGPQGRDLGRRRDLRGPGRRLVPAPLPELPPRRPRPPGREARPLAPGGADGPRGDRRHRGPRGIRAEASRAVPQAGGYRGMRSNPQVEEQVPLTLQIFTAEESFRERRRAIRLHRYLTRISTLALNAAW